MDLLRTIKLRKTAPSPAPKKRKPAGGMLAMMQDITNVKLRKTSLPRSPGGTPAKPKKAAADSWASTTMKTRRRRKRATRESTCASPSVGSFSKREGACISTPLPARPLPPSIGPLLPTLRAARQKSWRRFESFLLFLLNLLFIFLNIYLHNMSKYKVDPRETLLRFFFF